MVDGVCYRHTRGLTSCSMLRSPRPPFSLTWRIRGDRAGRPKGSRDKKPRLGGQEPADNLTQVTQRARASDVDVRRNWQVPTFDLESAAHWRHLAQVAALSPTPYLTLNGAAASPMYGAPSQHTLTAPHQRTALRHVAGPGLGRDHDLRPLVRGPGVGNHNHLQFEAPSASPSTPFNFSSIAEPCQRAPKFATVGLRPLDSQGSHHHRKCDLAGLRVQGNHDSDPGPSPQPPSQHHQLIVAGHGLQAHVPGVSAGCANGDASDLEVTPSPSLKIGSQALELRPAALALAPTTGQDSTLPCLSDGQSALAAANFDVDLAHRLSVLFEPWEVVSDTPQWQPDQGVVSLGAASAADESELDPFWKDWKPWLPCVRSAA